MMTAVFMGPPCLHSLAQLIIVPCQTWMQMSRWLLPWRLTLFDDLVNLFFELFVGAAAAFGQLARFTKGQAGVREGKAVDGFCRFFREEVAAIFQDDLDADF